MLGFARLAIIDLSAAGHQPMANPDQTIWIICNGEVYNFQSERKLLEDKGHTFVSSSDTEVVLHMYEHYGDDFLLRLRGMFALAIYDKRRGTGNERLLLARDHLGIKPLLFSRVGRRFVFASEMKALLASGLITPEIDPVALRQLLTFGSVLQPRTMLRKVKMLLPAHRLIIEHGRERLERYWSLALDRCSGLRTQPYEAVVEAVASALKESMRLHMISDVPLGAFLSGGVDSSILTAIMAQEAGHKVKTFSVGFESEGADIDESSKACQTAQFLGTDHTHVLVKGAEVRDQIEDIAAALDQPSVDGVNSYFISQAARRAVTVAVSGTGGDELFAGYPWFQAMVALRQETDRQGRVNTIVKRILAAIAQHPTLDPFLLKRGGGRLYRARERGGFLTQYAKNYQIFGDLGAAQLLSPHLRRAAQAGRCSSHDLKMIDELSGGSVIERVTGLCLRGYTNNQLLRDIDAASMVHSLEVRVPFLDHTVVDLALSLPDNAKLNGPLSVTASEHNTYRETGAKRALIDVGRPLLPKDFDLRPKKGFAMPFAAWLKGPLKDVLMETLSDEQVCRRGLFDVKEVAATRDGFLAGRFHWSRPWLLMMFELWCRKVLRCN